MPVAIELQNLGDAQLCREIAASIEHALGDKRESGVCRSPDREPVRIGSCEWKGSTALNARILWRVPPESINLRQFADLFSSWYRPARLDPLFLFCSTRPKTK